MKRKNVMVLLMSIMIMSTSITGCGGKAYSETAADVSASTGNVSVSSDSYYEEAVCMDAMASSETNSSMVKTETISESENMNTEEYSSIKEPGFKAVENEPLSTFSADVDTASYSNIRRMLEDGYTLDEIPSGAVRIEEMLNYFSYDYNLPSVAKNDCLDFLRRYDDDYNGGVRPKH